MKDSKDENLLLDMGRAVSMLIGMVDDTRKKLDCCSISFDKQSQQETNKRKAVSNVSPAAGLMVYGDYESCSEVSRAVRESRLQKEMESLLTRLANDYDFTPKVNREIQALITSKGGNL